MGYKKILGIFLVLIGAGLIIFGSIVSKKVQQGDLKIQRSQNTVDTVRGISRINPDTKKIGKAVTRPAQKKINQGKVEANRYRAIALWSKIGGILLIAVGGGMFFIALSNKQ